MSVLSRRSFVSRASESSLGLAPGLTILSNPQSKLVPAAVSQVRASVSGAILHVGDRGFCDLKQAALFKSDTSFKTV